MAYTTINKSTDYFNTKLYTGNGGTQSITGVGFQPDWVWLKERNTAVSHQVFDVIRGATKRLYPDDTSAENTNTNSLTAFGTDGFSLGNAGSSNGNSDTYVSWNWKGNGAGSANTDGTINSTVSANSTSGFSIVSYTGNGSASATVGHGLSVAPKMIIIKRRNASDTWYVMHTSLSSNYNVFLNNTEPQYNVSTYTGGLISTSPTSSVFSFVNGSSVNNVNASGGTYIAYCFAEKKGYSKFGSYTGNGNADGTFVYTGFKPSFVLFKRTAGSAANWQLWDNKRDTYNPVEKALHPDIPNTASTDQDIDFLSNGFKIRDTGGHINNSGTLFIYMAFGQSLVGSNNVPCTAR